MITVFILKYLCTEGTGNNNSYSNNKEFSIDFSASTCFVFPQVSVTTSIGLNNVMDNNPSLNSDLFEIYQFTI